MTAFEITIVLHYYYTDTPFNNESIAAEEAHVRLVNAGMLIRTENGYTANMETVDVYVEALKAIPLPVKKWVIPS